MLNRRKVAVVLCIIVCGMLVFCRVYANTVPGIRTSINKRLVLTGEVVRVVIVVKSDISAAISWQLCDQLFRESGRIVLLSTNTTHVNGSTNHEIAFTSARPGRFLVDSLPIVIDERRYFTGADSIDFRSAGLPLQLQDILPVKRTAIFSPHWLLLPMILVLSISLGKLFLFLLRDRQKTPSYSLITKNCLKGIEILEMAAATTSVGMKSLLEDTSVLLKTCRSLGPDSTDLMHLTIDKFQNELDQLSFLPPVAALASYHRLLGEVRALIVTHSTKP